MSREYDDRHERHDSRNGQQRSRDRQGAGDRKVAFAVTERGEKTFWLKVGTAFVNGDGSITVLLEAYPVSGKLQIRDDDRRRED